MLGKCLCGDIEFSVDIQTDAFKIYQCHCSLCKKQSGSSANSATIIEATHFKWIKSDNIKSAENCHLYIRFAPVTAGCHFLTCMMLFVSLLCFG